MIYLQSITKTYFGADEAPKPVFCPTTIAIPTDRRVAILGGRLQGKTTLLRMLAGLEAPNEGEVYAPLKLSPIANSRALLHPRLSGAENIRLFARMLGVDAEQLSLAVDSFCRLGYLLERPVNSLEGPQRQLLEVALVNILSFDCYLLDNAPLIPAELLSQCFEGASVRGAGMIFATNAPRQAYQHADCVVVICDYTMHAFSRVDEAIESYERAAR
jgi:capsular polysaccharide transport system ATP-binding protein